MPAIYNNPDYKKLRQQLRTEMPRAEMIMWKQLRREQVHGLKFHRQYGILNYIIDFYCPKIKLAVEIDGDSHYQAGANEKDLVRSDKLSVLGITVLRFDNNDVYNNRTSVMNTIYETAAKLLKLS